MRNLIDNLLRFGIVASLSDRDVFVETVSVQLEKYDIDPLKAEKLANIAAAYLDNVKDNINMRQSMRKVIDENDVVNKKDIEELNALLVQVTEELKQLKAKKDNV